MQESESGDGRAASAWNGRARDGRATSGDRERMPFVDIRPYEPGDAEEIAALARRNLLEVNVQDYPLDEMRALADSYDAARIERTASRAHTYVALDGTKIVGTGSIASYWGSATESILLTIFVLPECHGRGVGRKIMETLERDELFLGASRVEVPATLTACAFYEKMGYTYKNGVKQRDEEGSYRMEKRR